VDIDADPLALQLGDGPNGFVREQLETAGMHACERSDRHAGIQASDLRCCVSKSKVELAPSNHLRIRGTRPHSHVLDVGEALGAQQVLGDVPRRDAN